MRTPRSRPVLAAAVAALGLAAACRSRPPAPSPKKERAPVAGRVLVGGESVPVAVRVVGPRDPGGFDGTLERCWFTPERTLPAAPAPGCDEPRRYGVRSTAGLPAADAARVAARGWDRDAVARRVDQVVLHYDAAGTSQRCFQVLHDERGLSCHFLLDADGTLRQTLDLAHRARHATAANDRSVGIEIAHVGAYPHASSFAPFYRPSGESPPHRLVLDIPARFGPPPGGPFALARPDWVRGTVNGSVLVQPDYTEAQYRTLEQALPELRRVLPRVAAQVPRGRDGRVLTDALAPAELAAFRGVLGHSHVQRDKTDPGPAFDWDRIATTP
ncbi:MAG: N-acetylmuramoyl-L-alanine amidase [Burkholderiales bacterium]|nr:N-acetylmuramoyl-L-alanine amidase [Burkholderiales bacterium]